MTYSKAMLHYQRNDHVICGCGWRGKVGELWVSFDENTMDDICSCPKCRDPNIELDISNYPPEELDFCGLS